MCDRRMRKIRVCHWDLDLGIPGSCLGNGGGGGGMTDGTASDKGLLKKAMGYILGSENS